MNRQITKWLEETQNLSLSYLLKHFQFQIQTTTFYLYSISFLFFFYKTYIFYSNEVQCATQMKLIDWWVRHSWSIGAYSTQRKRSSVLLSFVIVYCILNHIFPLLTALSYCLIWLKIVKTVEPVNLDLLIIQCVFIFKVVYFY